MAWLDQFADLAQFDDGMLCANTTDELSFYCVGQNENVVRIADIFEGMVNIVRNIYCLFVKFHNQLDN